MRKSDPPWLLFEKEIFNLQKLVTPEKNVFHDKSVRSITGRSRQVDVVVEDIISKCFDALECRDCKRPQDVTWVEKAVGQRISLMAQNIILVSSSGFTRDAILTARHFDQVHLRDLVRVSQPESLLKIHPKAIEVSFLEFGDGLNCKLYTDPPRLPLPDGLDFANAEFATELWSVSPDSFLQRACELNDARSKLPVNQWVDVTLKFIDDAVRNVRFRAPSIDYQLKEVEFQGRAIHRRLVVPHPTSVKYYNADSGSKKKPLAAVARYEYVSNGNRFFFEVKYVKQGCVELVSSSVDRPCNIKFATVPWESLANGIKLI